MCSPSSRITWSLLFLLGAGACEREERRLQEPAPGSRADAGIVQTQLAAGPYSAGSPNEGPYDENAYAISQGQRYFRWFNCVGCHANGGGGMGPPLMDSEWIYGSAPDNIFATIVEGRPNGMPSFRGRIPDQQVWQLVAYVRSLAGLTRMDARPGRRDGMRVKEPEMLEETAPPTSSASPAPAPQP